MKAKDVKERRGTVLKKTPLPRSKKGTNVFVNESFAVPIVRRFGEGYKPVDDNGTLVYKKFGYNEEYTNFTKVYLTTIGRNKVVDLSLRAKEMYLHIQYFTEAGFSKIKLDKDYYCKKYNIKPTTFFNTRMELMEAHIILDVKGEKDMYWINPFYIYNGKRTKDFEPFLELKYNYTGDNYEQFLKEEKEKYWNSNVDNED